MNELQKAATELVERAKRAAVTIPGFEMTVHEDDEKDLTFNEYLLINHYENQKEQVTDAIDDNTFKLNDIYYQLRLIINYISLVNEHCAAKEEKNIFNLHHLLYDDSGLQNIEEMLQAVSRSVNEVGGQLLEGSGNEVTSHE